MADIWEIKSRILSVVNDLSGRFPDNTEQFVIDFVKAGEEVLAIETLCTQICEYTICLSSAEKNALLALGRELEMDTQKLGELLCN